MKRSLIFVSAIALAAILSGCAKSETSSPPSGPVRSMTVADDESSYESTQSSVGNSQQSSSAVSVPEDIEGKYKRIATGTRYFEGEGTPFTYTEIFDEYDNCVFSYDGWFQYTYIYEYNSDGLVTKKASDASNTCITYKYDGSLLIKQCLYEGDKLKQTKTFEYNERGDEVRVTIELAATGEVKTGPAAEYEYGENEKWITRKYYDRDTHELSSTETHTYDEKGRVTSYTIEFENKKITEEYKYDDRGNKTENRRLEARDGEAYYDRRSESVYDAQNREVKCEVFVTENDKETLLEHIEYEYVDL